MKIQLRKNSFIWTAKVLKFGIQLPCVTFTNLVSSDYDNFAFWPFYCQKLPKIQYDLNLLHSSPALSVLRAEASKKKYAAGTLWGGRLQAPWWVWLKRCALLIIQVGVQLIETTIYNASITTTRIKYFHSHVLRQWKVCMFWNDFYWCGCKCLLLQSLTVTWQKL